MKSVVKNHSSLKVVAVLILVFGTCVSFAARSEKRTPVTFVSGMKGYLFDLNLYYGQSEASATPTVGNTGIANEFKNNAAIYDIKLGYVWQWGGYVGAVYSLRSDESLTSSSKGSGIGAGAGFFLPSNVNLRVFYRMNETLGDYKDGTGVQVDLGYMINLTAKLVLGLVVTHRTISYTTNETISRFSGWTPSYTNPAITLGYIF